MDQVLWEHGQHLCSVWFCRKYIKIMVVLVISGEHGYMRLSWKQNENLVNILGHLVIKALCTLKPVSPMSGMGSKHPH